MSSTTLAEKVRSIPVIGPLSLTEREALATVAAATHARRALEVGHYLGLSTSVLLTSLPPEVELVTVDHHQGDQWCPSTSFDTFLENVQPYVADRSFVTINDDMEFALPNLSGLFGFCFYDADHTAEAVETFWRVGASLLAPDCVLVFDDADWEEQSTLRTLAEADGFQVVTGREFHRPEGDKNDPETYTLEVMRRG